MASREDLTAAATMDILGAHPYPREMLVKEEFHVEDIDVEEIRPGKASTGHPIPKAAPAGAAGHLNLSIPVVIMEGAPCVLSLGTVAAADWVLVTSHVKGVPSCLHLPSVGAIPLRPSGSHDMMLDIVPHRTSTTERPV